MDNNQFNGSETSLYTQPINPYEVQQDVSQNPYAQEMTGNNPYTANNQYTGNNPYAESNQYTDANPYVANNQYTGNNPYVTNNPYEANNPYTYTTGWMNNNSIGHYYVPAPGTTPVPVSSDGMGLAIAGMVCGIVSDVFCCTWIFALIVAVVGLILSIAALVRKSKGKGMAIAGVVCSAIGIVLFVLFTIMAYLDM